MSAVTIKLMGGLGNQLFQYATARALTLRTGAELKIDLSSYIDDPLRRYELASYSINGTIINNSDGVRSRNFVNQLKKVLRLLQSREKYYREPHFHYDPSVRNLSVPVFLEGYWQSEKYFAEHAINIRHDLIPIQPLELENAIVAEQIRSVNAVSVHVRRGDYVENVHTNSYHGVCSIEYYRAAIDWMRRSVGEIHLFIFSDDHEWTKHNLQTNCPTTYVIANPPDRGFRDMQLMAMCRHHIIANSSFSWWGAWLNPRPDKIVIAPKKWFANSENDTRDLIPDAWVRL
jgi:hypothetical protein